MHKLFYASGFLYHLPTQQILLQQNFVSSSDSFWSLLGKEHEEKEISEDVFKNVLVDLLHLHVNVIYPIYSYLQETTNKNHSLLYATVEKLQEFPQKNDCIFKWFSFKEILKLPLSEQMQHDIVVGHRVVEAMGRKSRGEQTLL